MKTGKAKIQWIAGAVAAGGFCFLLLLVLSDKEGCLDDPIRHFFYGLRSDALTPLAIGITDLSNTKFIIALCLILLILPQTRNVYGIPVSMGAIFVTILNKTMTHINQRPRPEDIQHLVQEGGYSRARRPENDADLAAVDCRGDVDEHLHAGFPVAVVLGKALDDEVGGI